MDKHLQANDKNKAGKRVLTISILFTLALLLAGITGIAQTAYVSMQYPYISVVDIPSNMVIDSIPVGITPIGVAASKDGKRVYVANLYSSSVCVINTATNKVTDTVAVEPYPFGIAVSPDGSRVYVTTSYGQITVINTATVSVIATINVDTSPACVVVSPDNQKVYVANDDINTIHVINASTYAVTSIIQVGGNPIGIAITPDGKKVYVANYDDRTVSVIDAVADTVLGTVPVGHGPKGVVVTPDGRKVYVSSDSVPTVTVINALTDTVLSTISVRPGPSGVSVTPDGSKVVVVDFSNRVQMISTATDRVLSWVWLDDYAITYGNFISAPPPVANFSATDSDICANDCINFTDLSVYATSWQWNFEGAIDSISTDRNPQNICYGMPGTYSVKMIANGAGGSDSITLNNYINVKASPPEPIITQSNDTLFCSTSASYISYQWYADSVPITNATDTFLVIAHGGNYNVRAANASGCLSSAGIITGFEELTKAEYVSLFPNPAENNLQVTIGNWQLLGDKPGICIYNILGELCYQSEIRSPKFEVDVSSLPQGVFLLEIKWNDGSIIKRFAKE